MTQFPENPFRPGAGRKPAHMGHRPEVENVLSGFLRTLRGDEPDLQLGFLYGPRGNGKTVLLHWLHAEAAAAETTTVRLDVRDLESPATAIRAIRPATRRFPRVWEWLPPLTAEYQGVRMRLGAAGESSLTRVLKRGRGGILLTLDEAHEAPPEMLGFLLRAAQAAGESRPVAVVLAGTPGLALTLLETHASFWSRGRQLPIGLLSEMSAREALALPFRDAGLETDDGAVAGLAAAADNYPYLLQLYGEAAWQVVEASGGRTLLPEHVRPAAAAAYGPRQRYYGVRYEEFLKAELLPLARRVAEVFVDSAEAPADRCLTDATLNGLLAYEGGYDHRRFLIARGYVWQDAPEGLSWTPGIPSLMDYMLTRIPAS